MTDVNTCRYNRYFGCNADVMTAPQTLLILPNATLALLESGADVIMGGDAGRKHAYSNIIIIQDYNWASVQQRKAILRATTGDL